MRSEADYDDADGVLHNAVMIQRLCRLFTEMTLTFGNSTSGSHAGNPEA